MEDYEAKEKKMVKDAVNNLSNFVNKFGAPDKKFAQEVMNEHRTLQQSMMRLFLATIEEWSKQTQYDLRNEDTIRISKKIMSVMEDEGLRFV